MVLSDSIRYRSRVPFFCSRKTILPYGTNGRIPRSTTTNHDLVSGPPFSGPSTVSLYRLPVRSIHNLKRTHPSLSWLPLSVPSVSVSLFPIPLPSSSSSSLSSLSLVPFSSVPSSDSVRSPSSFSSSARLSTGEPSNDSLSATVTDEEYQQLREQINQCIRTTSGITNSVPSLSALPADHPRLLASLVVWYEDLFQRYITIYCTPNRETNKVTPVSVVPSKSSSSSSSKYRYTSMYRTFSPVSSSSVSPPPSSSSSSSSLSLSSLVTIGMDLWLYCSQRTYFTQAHLLWSLFRTTPVCYPYLSSTVIERYFLALFRSNPLDHKAHILVQTEKLIMMMDSTSSLSRTNHPMTTPTRSSFITSVILQIALYCCSLDNNLSLATEIWSTVVVQRSNSPPLQPLSSPTAVLVPTIDDYNALLYVISQCGTANDALQILHTLKTSSVSSLRPNEFTYNYIFETVGKTTPGIYKVLSLYEEMMNNQDITPTSLTFATLLNLPYLRTVFLSREEKRMQGLPIFSSGSTEIELPSHKYTRYINDVRKLMDQARITPDALIYTVLVRYYLATDNFEPSHELMQNYSSSSSVTAADSLLRLYSETSSTSFPVLPSVSSPTSSLPDTSFLSNLTYHRLLHHHQYSFSSTIPSSSLSTLPFFTHSQLLQPYVLFSKYLLTRLLDDRRYHAYLYCLYHQSYRLLTGTSSFASLPLPILTDFLELSTLLTKSAILTGNYLQALDIFTHVWTRLTRLSLSQSLQFTPLPNDCVLGRYSSTLTPYLTEMFRTLLRGRYLYPDNISLHSPTYGITYDANTQGYYENDDILNLLELYRYYVSPNQLTLPQSLFEAVSLAGNDKIDLPLVHTIILSLEEEKVSGTPRMYEGALLTVYKTLQIMYSQYITEFHRARVPSECIKINETFYLPTAQRKYYTKIMGNLIDKKDDIFTMAQDIVKTLLGSGIVCRSTLTGLLLYIDNITFDLLEMQKTYTEKVTKNRTVGKDEEDESKPVNDDDSTESTKATDRSTRSGRTYRSSRASRRQRSSRTVEDDGRNNEVEKKKKKYDEDDVDVSPSANGNEISSTVPPSTDTTTYSDQELEATFNELRSVHRATTNEKGTIPSPLPLSSSSSTTTATNKVSSNSSSRTSKYTDQDIVEEGINILRKRQQQQQTNEERSPLRLESKDEQEETEEDVDTDEEGYARMNEVLQESVQRYTVLVTASSTSPAVPTPYTSLTAEPLMGTIDYTFANDTSTVSSLIEPVYIARLRTTIDLRLSIDPYYENLLDKDDERYAAYAEMKTDKQLLQEVQNTNKNDSYASFSSSSKDETTDDDVFSSIRSTQDDENDTEGNEIVLDGDTPIPSNWGSQKATNRSSVISNVVTKETTTKTMAKKFASSARNRYYGGQYEEEGKKEEKKKEGKS